MPCKQCILAYVSLNPSPFPVQVYRPLEFLFTIAAFTTLAENFLPQLIALPKVSSDSAYPAACCQEPIDSCEQPSAQLSCTCTQTGL